jgi:hypothetical protein
VSVVPDAAMYARVFDMTPEGKVVLEDLVAKFGRNPYVAGGHEGDRETCKRAGQLSVVSHILNQINRASGLDVPEESP